MVIDWSNTLDHQAAEIPSDSLWSISKVLPAFLHFCKKKYGP